MNIIFIINSPYPYYTGGRETWLYNVCNKICDKYNVSIISEKKFYSDNRYGVITGINPSIKIYQVKTLQSISWLRPFLKSYLSYFVQYYSELKMKKILKQVILNIPREKTYIITMDTVFCGSVGKWAKKIFDSIYYISSVRGPHAEITSSYYPMLKKFILNKELNNLKVADRIWVNGYDTQENIDNKGFKSVVIKNGTDITKVDNINIANLENVMYSNEPKIVMIGSLLDIKGYKELIRAIAIIHNQFKIKVHMIGIGKGDPASYISIAEKERILEYVHFLGYKENAVAYAKCADVITCLSGGGGFSMAAIECLATKKPVVAWDSPVYRQMIRNNENGVLVETNNVELLAQSIVYLIKNPEICIRLGNAAYDKVLKFDWQYVVDEVDLELKRLANEK